MRKTEIIPVIHVVDTEQVMQNMLICATSGINKVFLINHETGTKDLLDMFEFVEAQFPNMWIGLNLLSETNKGAMAVCRLYKTDGCWMDKTVTADDLINYKGMTFGGFAFKYQKQPKDLAEEAKEAIKYTDVLTTSGPGTGMPANIFKINTIREAIGNHPMAIASGVNIENIQYYKGVVDYLLVASSITGPGEIIIKERLVELINAL